MEVALAAGGDLLGDVIDWGWGALQDLWTQAPEIAKEALVDAGAQTITDFTTGAIGELVTWVTGGIEDIAWIPDWVKSAFDTFAYNVGDALGNIATAQISMARGGALEILGVTNAQELYMTELQNSISTTFDAIITRIQTEGIIEEESAIETIDIYFDYANQTIDITSREVEQFFRQAQTLPAAKWKELTDLASSQLRATREALQESEKVARELADRDLVGASVFLAEMSLKYPERYMNDIQETIIIPIANAQAFQWALSNVDPITREALKDTIIETMIVQNEVAVEMAEQNRFVPKPTP